MAGEPAIGSMVGCVLLTYQKPQDHSCAQWQVDLADRTFFSTL